MDRGVRDLPDDPADGATRGEPAGDAVRPDAPGDETVRRDGDPAALDSIFAVGGPERDHRERRRRRRKVLAWIGGTLALLLVIAVGTGYWLFANLDGNIKHEKADSSSLGDQRPVKLNKSTNILLLGSDSRSGENAAYGDSLGQRSDTTLLLHISPTGDKAVGISFPRDSMVNVPACKTKTGMTKPYFGMINSAFAYAGPLCTWKTIEQNTGIHIDHFVVVDFAGFKRVVDALGGVEICLNKAINDPRAQLSLPAGRQVVKGDEALGFVRERYLFGDGSDLGRIKRQQQFMSSIVHKAVNTNMLSNPLRTYSFLDAATKSITTDDGLTVGVMKDLASTLKGMDSGGVTFVTVPNHPYPKDPNRVVWDEQASDDLFTAIKQDDNLPALPGPGAQPTEPQLTAAQVKITVLQAGKGNAKKSATRLRGKGVNVTRTGTTQETVTRIAYGLGAGGQASDLAALLAGDVNPVENPKLPMGAITLVIGGGGLVFASPAAPAAAFAPAAYHQAAYARAATGGPCGDNGT